MQGPLILLILDGWGLAPKTRGNAVEQAKKPNFDKLWKKYPRTQLKAHGKYVGLPKGYVGNSEAGHINIGAGRVVVDDAVLISQDIKTGRFQRNMALEQTVNFVLEKKSALHLMGLVSEGQSPHAVLKHLYALVDLAASRGVEKIYLHLFTDGRDAPQYASLDIIEQIMKKIGNKAELVSLIGRFYAMDRGRNWQRTKKAYECFTEAKGQVFSDYKKAVLHAYNKKVTDEYVQPSLIGKSLKEIKDTRIKEKDGVIFFNARSDRARQLTKCFVQPNFNQRNKKAFKR
ncbi:MAG TPA: 2,3-bisphosphoglycerate-independent phosphoglycerate mutase, partial [Patescibacteria group bacterium]|nr:2,3-bisphosphoglycerate-independent phosphoglycerate mutase [Patescibacteria group bacterium]